MGRKSLPEKTIHLLASHWPYPARHGQFVTVTEYCRSAPGRRDIDILRRARLAPSDSDMPSWKRAHVALLGLSSRRTAPSMATSAYAQPMQGARWRASTRNQCRDVLRSANRQRVRELSCNATRRRFMPISHIMSGKTGMIVITLVTQRDTRPSASRFRPNPVSLPQPADPV